MPDRPWHRDEDGLTGYQYRLLVRAVREGRVHLDGKHRHSGRGLIRLGFCKGPPQKLPDGSPSARWIEATAQGRRLVKAREGSVPRATRRGIR